MFTRILKSSELQGTIIITAGSILGSFFAYLLQFFLGRLLSVADYGSFSAFLSLATIVGVPATVFSVILVKVVSELLAKEDFRKLTALFWRVSLWGLLWGIILFFGVYFLKRYISSTFQIDNMAAIIFYGAFLSVSAFPNISRAYLQGLLRYKSFAAFAIYSGFLRFIFPVILVYVGYALKGVFFGMGLGLLMSYFVSMLHFKKNFTEHDTSIDLSPQYKRFLTLGLPVAFLNFGLMALNNIDMILVKRFFSPELAGYYAGTVTLGKILLFGAGSVTIVMFPHISALYAKGEDYRRNFGKLFMLQVLVVTIGVISYIVFPRFLTNAFFGSRFINSVGYIPLFAVFIGLYVLVNFMVMFLLAIDRKNVFWFLVPGAAVQYIMISIFHESLNQIIYINITVTLLIYIALLIYYKVTSTKNSMQYND